jgi:hypothetical protein
MSGLRGRAMLGVTVLAMLVTISGPRDGLWFAERAWALLITGWFVGLTMALPTWRLTSRAMVSVLGALTVGLVALGMKNGAWSTLDWMIEDGVFAGVATTLDGMEVIRDGRPMSAAFVGAMYEMARAQAAVFPALVSLASMAALGVAWWVYTRVSGGGDQAIGRVGDFRFNDQMIWLFVAGLLLIVTRWEGPLSRVGANAVVFMSALYALRGAGVVWFVTGGLSFVSYLLLAMAVVLVAPAVLGAAVLIGIGDTWLDFRARARQAAA